jgi:hypothetical protein
MTPNFTEQELKELKIRFNDIVVDDSLVSESIVHTLSTGRIVKGNITENQVLQVKSVSSYLCG